MSLTCPFSKPLTFTVALLLTACGGGEPADSTSAGPLPVTELRERPLATTPATNSPAVSNEQLFTWAQLTFPELFGTAPPQAMTVPYQGRTFDVRFFAARNAYLGVADGEAFGLGDFTGGALQSFGPVSNYADAVCARVGCTPVAGARAGITWTPVTSLPATPCSGTVNGIVQGTARWVAVGDSGCIRTSIDGLTWTAGVQPFSGFGLADVAWGGGRFVAVGTRGRLMASNDGLTWTAPVQTAGAANVNAVLWLGDRFLAVGDRAGDGVNLYTSRDALTWSESKLTTDPTIPGIQQKLVAVAANGSTLVAVGGATINYTAWRSTDGGARWQFVGSKQPGDGGFVLGVGIGEARATGVAYGNGIWVAVGAMADWAVSSDDGLTWRTGRVDAAAPPGVAINRVWFDGLQFVAVGNQKRIYTSDDGQTWTRRHVDTSLSTALVKGHFRAVAGSGAARLVVTGTVDSTGGSGFMTSAP